MFGGFFTAAIDVDAQDINGNDNNGIVIIGDETPIRTDIIYENVFGILDYDASDPVTNKMANNGDIHIINASADSSICIYGGLAMNNDSNASKLGDAQANENKVRIDNLVINITSQEGEIYGGGAISRPNGNTGHVYANNNEVSLLNSDITTSIVIGGYVSTPGAASRNAQANYNDVKISGSNVNADIRGGHAYVYSAGNSAYDNDIRDAITETKNNTILIHNNSTIGSIDNLKSVYGSYIYYYLSGNTAVSEINNVTIKDSSVYADVYGTYMQSFQCSTGNEDSNGTDTVLQANNNMVTIENSNVVGKIVGAYTYDDNNYLNAESKNINNEVRIGDNTSINGAIYGADNYSRNSGGKAVNCEVIGNSVILEGNIKVLNSEGAIYGGSAYSYAYDWGGDFQAGDIIAKQNKVTINGEIEIESDIYGAYAKSQGGGVNDRKPSNNGFGNSGNVITEDNHIIISGGRIKGNIYAGYAESIAYGEGEYGNVGTVVANNNTITLQNNADLSNTNLYGSNLANNDTQGNDLIIDGWQGKVNSANNFNNIKFQNLNWQNEGTILEIGSTNGSDLANTNINLISIAGGQKINAGDYMYIIKGNGNLNIDETLVDNNFSEGAITAGVATEINGEAFVDDDGNVQYKVNGISASDQIDLVAENRAVAAAFVNQGTDLINDSLDVLSRNGKYGIKTFAAVHGNRSKYDVNSDLKINGWSSIVGVGNEKNIGNGDFSWGVFYENGSGNYRTYNEFNNEFFRGDGSLVYNGGGIAARFEQDNGVYTEGSLRAGMLKSEMTNALKDGAGNSYGYKSESTYYGAHIGVGKIISLNEATDIDVYGKFFHTYTDGDSFAVAGDKFEFDSITSDRLRIGARLTTNKENKFSTYYGLAYEYEFNGDADMRAQNMSAPEQSLKGSSCMAEIGMNYKPSSESPWSFDLSMRGYAGQRDGFSGNVQATYTF